MAESFYYGTDAELAAGARTFAHLINLDPAAYGLAPLQAEQFQVLSDVYSAAYKIAKEPSTCTRPAVTAKNLAKTELKNAARMIGNFIIANPAVDDSQLSALGLKPRNGRSRIPRPETSPTVNVASANGRRIELRLRDAGGNTRGKPHGVAGATIFLAVSETSSFHEADWTPIASTTRTNTTVEVPESIAPGSKIWFCARWYNNRHQPGQPGPAINTYVQFGGGISFGGGIVRAA